ncbi:hypothetical protein LDG_9041 [Legionella drancourtii LLAP12]|uniref:Uncharacterized protein n=1 Tax=Legionella drancourtii LLAP12 TaxID=658187 RepID=G9EUP3_9GAMM|nr:hypothetical protein LDG_9041 [Legionella drancourtii LLAP12]
MIDDHRIVTNVKKIHQRIIAYFGVHLRAASRPETSQH